MCATAFDVVFVVCRVLSDRKGEDGNHGNGMSSRVWTDVLMHECLLVCERVRTFVQHTFTLVAVNPVAFRLQPVTTVLNHTMDVEQFDKALTSVQYVSFSFFLSSFSVL